MFLGNVVVVGDYRVRDVLPCRRVLVVAGHLVSLFARIGFADLERWTVWFKR